MTHLLSVHGLPFLACLAMLAILSYIGIHVLKREIIFIDIALAQIAAVGAVAAHVVFHFHEDSIMAYVLALGATTLAAAFFALVRRAVVQIPLEAVIGVSYAVSAAAALFLMGVAPGGHVHVQGMLSGSVLWATWDDVLWSAAAFVLVGLCFRLFRKPFRAISEDYEAAAAAGYNTLAWDFLFYALVGVVVTLAVRVAGVVLVFAFLIIPATLSAVFTSGWKGRLFIAWGAGAVSSLLGLSFADRYDFSVGPAIALFLGEALILVGLLRLARVARTLAGAVWLVSAVTLAIWFTASPATDHPRAAAQEAPPHLADAARADHHEETQKAREEVTQEALSAIAEVGSLRRFYEAAADSEEKGMIVCRWLEVDLRTGAGAAIDFLSDDPPLFFQSMVVAKLRTASGREFSYDVKEPFEAESNREAVTRLERELGVER